MVQIVLVKTVKQLIYSKERAFLLQWDLSLVVFPESPTFIKRGLYPLQLKQEMAIVVSRILGLTSFLKLRTLNQTACRIPLRKFSLYLNNWISMLITNSCWVQEKGNYSFTLEYVLHMKCSVVLMCCRWCCQERVLTLETLLNNLGVGYPAFILFSFLEHLICS